MEPTNTNLALVMYVVATMVAGHADAPPLCGGHFTFDAVYHTGRPVEFLPRAGLHIASVAPAAMVRDAALWAERLDTDVRFDRFSGYFRMEVATEVGGVRVEVWTNISPEGLAEVLPGELAARAEAEQAISPAELLSALPSGPR